MPPWLPRSSRSLVTSSTNSGTPPVRAATSSTTSSGNAWRAESPSSCLRAPGRDRAAPAKWCRDASACSRAGGTPAASSPRRTAYQCPALGNTTENVERGRIGPAANADPRTPVPPAAPARRPYLYGQRRQSPAAQFVGRNVQCALLGQWEIQQGRPIPTISETDRAQVFSRWHNDGMIGYRKRPRRAPRNLAQSDFFHVPAEPRQYKNSAPYLEPNGKCTRSRRMNRPKSRSRTAFHAPTISKRWRSVRLRPDASVWPF